MDINLRDWLTANLGTNDTVSALILVLMTILLVFIVWWLSKKMLHYFIPKLTAKTETLWDDIIFNGLKYSYVKSGRKGHHELAELILKGRLSFPTVVFLDEGLKVIQPIPGYQDSRSMELIITYFARDYHKDTPWKKYTTMYNSNMIQDAGF